MTTTTGNTNNLTQHIKTHIGELTFQIITQADAINSLTTENNQLKQEAEEFKKKLAIYEPVADTVEDK